MLPAARRGILGTSKVQQGVDLAPASARRRLAAMRTVATTGSGKPNALSGVAKRYGIDGLKGGSPMQFVSDILKSKADQTVHTIGPAATIADAVALMGEKKISALVVVEHGEVVGIVTERDFTQKFAVKQRSSRKAPISTIMTSPVLHVTPDQTTEDCMMLMGRNHLRHLPVIDGGRLVGMVSVRDLVNDLIANL
jgi:CBS domain-containing protein